MPILKGDPGYEDRKKREARRNADQSAAGRDIGDFHGRVNQRRYDSCRYNFKIFCESYLPGWFPLAWSNDHLKAIERIEKSVLKGGQFAFAMPRGSGKTTLCIAAALWAILYGHRKFVVMIGAEAGHAEELSEAWKLEIETNDLLFEDFPEACIPVRKLEGINHRAGGQTYKGERTRIEWAGKEAKLAYIPNPDFLCSGGTVRACGLTGRLRGMKTTIGSEQVRPGLVIVDDPQTDESANSPSQNATREKLISGAVLGLAGPVEKIAAFMPCTVIAPNDAVSRILDRDKNPQWHGERSKMMVSFPKNSELWDVYYQIRGDDLRDGGSGEKATEYYRLHREQMDEGAEVYWPERFNPDEDSAIQSAMNLKQDRPKTFWAEYQNEPLSESMVNDKQLTTEDVLNSLNKQPRYEYPEDTTRITCGIDLGAEVLWYTVTAWNEHFGGCVIDYGCWPRQRTSHFAQANASPSLSEIYPNRTEDTRIYAGLVDLVNAIMSTSYTNGSGTRQSIDRICIDSGHWTQTVYEFCKRSSPYSGLLTPTKGRAVITGAPITEWKLEPGMRSGYHWRFAKPLLMLDPNPWKSQLAEAWKVPFGTKGKLSIFGENQTIHSLFVEHMASEFPTSMDRNGRKFEAWTRLPGFENHWLDCLVLSAVGASFAGLSRSVTGEITPPKPTGRKPTVGEIYRQSFQKKK